MLNNVTVRDLPHLKLTVNCAVQYSRRRSHTPRSDSVDACGLRCVHFWCTMIGSPFVFC